MALHTDYAVIIIKSHFCTYYKLKPQGFVEVFSAGWDVPSPAPRPWMMYVLRVCSRRPGTIPGDPRRSNMDVASQKRKAGGRSLRLQSYGMVRNIGWEKPVLYRM